MNDRLVPEVYTMKAPKFYRTGTTSRWGFWPEVFWCGWRNPQMPWAIDFGRWRFLIRTREFTRFIPESERVRERRGGSEDE